MVTLLTQTSFSGGDLEVFRILFPCHCCVAQCMFSNIMLLNFSERRIRTSVVRYVGPRCSYLTRISMSIWASVSGVTARSWVSWLASVTRHPVWLHQVFGNCIHCIWYNTMYTHTVLGRSSFGLAPLSHCVGGSAWSRSTERCWANLSE